MYKIKTDDYARLLEETYESKAPMMVYGGPGIGKTEIPLQVFRKTAEKLKRKFVQWTDLSLAEKKKLIANPDGWFVFCDQRIGQMDSTDLRGIPNMASPDFLETMPLSWIVFFTQPDAHGVIFFDEINLAAPVVAGQAYQIINERTVADRRLSKHVHIIAAGNRATDRAFTFEMPFPLRDRFAEVELQPDVKSWTVWAAGNVNPHFVAFVNWKESYLYKIVESGADKSSTPRGIVRASRLVGDKDILSADVHMLVSIAAGEAFATEFQAYTKHFASLDWTHIYNHPESVKGWPVDKTFAVVGGMAEHFQKDSSPEMLKKIIAVIPHMKADFSVICIRMLRDFGQDKFLNAVKKVPEFVKIARDYAKYLMG